MRRLACALALAALLSPVAAQAAVSAGAYGSIARLTPSAIALGKGDGHLIGLAQAIAAP